MKLLAYLFIYKAERLPLFGKFTELDIRTEERVERVKGLLEVNIYILIIISVPNYVSRSYTVVYVENVFPKG